MAQTNFADSVLAERPGSKPKAEGFNPLNHSAATDPQEPAKPGYRVSRQRGGQELSLILELANGDMFAPEYMYLVSKQLLTSQGAILLRFTDCTITLKGRNLKEVFLQLCRHSVVNITEIPLEEDHYPMEETIIHQIITESDAA